MRCQTRSWKRGGRDSWIAHSRKVRSRFSGFMFQGRQFGCRPDEFLLYYTTSLNRRDLKLLRALIQLPTLNTPHSSQTLRTVKAREWRARERIVARGYKA